MAVLGLCFCARAFSSCGKRGPLFIAVRGPLTVAASLVAEHRLQTHRLSNCGSRAQLPRGMWDLPRPGLEPVSTALAGRLSTTAPPGKPQMQFFLLHWCWSHLCCSEKNNLNSSFFPHLHILWYYAPNTSRIWWHLTHNCCYALLSSNNSFWLKSPLSGLPTSILALLYCFLTTW